MLTDKLSRFPKTSFILSVRFSYLRVLSCLAFIMLLSGCTAPNYVWPAYDKITLYANLDVNPDDNERPSPIQVKVYELAARTTFDNLDFQSLFTNGTTLLSDELISEKTFFIQPNETITYKIELNKAATHVAIIAAYRKIDNARWKHIYPIKFYGYYKHSIEFTNDAIEIRKSERSKHSEDNKGKEKTGTARKDRNGKGTNKASEEPKQQKNNSDQSEFKKTVNPEENKIPKESNQEKPLIEKGRDQKNIRQVWST